MFTEFDRLLTGVLGEIPDMSPAEAKSLLRDLFADHVSSRDKADGRGWLSALAIVQHHYLDNGQRGRAIKIAEITDFFLQRPSSIKRGATFCSHCGSRLQVSVAGLLCPIIHPPASHIDENGLYVGLVDDDGFEHCGAGYERTLFSRSKPYVFLVSDEVMDTHRVAFFTRPIGGIRVRHSLNSAVAGQSTEVTQ